MSKMRVYQLAKELGLSSKELIEKLLDLNLEISNHMSALDDSDVEMILELFTETDEKTNTETNKTDRGNGGSSVNGDAHRNSVDGRTC